MNRQINRENYEVFLIDHLEGKLNEEQESELAVFLADNPDLEEEFNCLNSLREERLEPITPAEMDFSFLKKPETAIIREEEMIAAFENDLSQNALQELKRKLLDNPQYQRDFDLFKLSRLQKEEIPFEGKEKLKKKTGIVISLNYRLASIAAVLLAVVLLGVLYKGSILPQSPPQIAEIQDINKAVPSDEKLAFTKKEEGKNNKNTKQAITQGTLLKQLAITPQEMPQLLSAKAAFVATDSTVYLPPQAVKVTPYLASKPIAPMQENKEMEYLKPSEWLLNKMKQQLPQTALAYADTMQRAKGGGAGNTALNLLAKTTGISIEDRKDTETGTKGFAIVSRYFSYERMIHP